MESRNDTGLTAREAVQRYCDYWTWAGTVSDDPAVRDAALREAAIDLGRMLRHEVPPSSPNESSAHTTTAGASRQVAELASQSLKRTRAMRLALGGNDITDADRRRAVSRAMMNPSVQPDPPRPCPPVPLWATGRKLDADGTLGAHEGIEVEDWQAEPDGRGFLQLDVFKNRAFGAGVEYVDLRIFDVPTSKVADGVEAERTSNNHRNLMDHGWEIPNDLPLLTRRSSGSATKIETTRKYAEWLACALHRIKLGDTAIAACRAIRTAIQTQVGSAPASESISRALDDIKEFEGWSSPQGGAGRQWLQQHCKRAG